MALTSQITTSLLQVDGRMTEGGVIEIVPGARLLLDVGVENIEPGALLDEIASAVAEAKAARDQAVDVSGISTTDAAVKAGFEIPGSQSGAYLSATIATEGGTRFERLHGGRKRSACTPGATDQTAVVQAEIDALASFGGGVLELPGGAIILDGVVMKHRVSLKGSGAFSTRVQAKAGSTNAAVFLLGTGPVQQAWISDMRIMPNGNAGQHGIFFKARDSSGDWDTPSGWWDGGLRNVQIGDDSAQFAGHGIWLSGGGATHLGPHQWLTFENVHVANSNTGCGLLLSGQIGQMVIINGGFNGRSNNATVTTTGTRAGVDIYMTQQLTDAGALLDATYPYGISIVGTSIQSNGQGVRVEGGNAITLVNPHFEDTAQCLYVDNAYVSWTGGRASNATNTGLTGYVAKTGNTGRAVVTQVRAYGTIDRHFDGFIQGAGNLFEADPKTANMTWQVTPDATGWVNMRERNTAILNASANALKTIQSHLVTGETMYLKAHGGAVTIDTGGNITLGGRNGPVSVPQNGVATFIRVDLAGTWMLVSISGQVDETVKTVTGSYAFVPADEVVIGNAPTTSTVTLLDPTTVRKGRRHTVKNINATALNVASAGTSKTIDGAASVSLAQWATGRYISDGAQWLSV